MTKEDYNSILKDVYDRAINKQFDEFKEGLPCYTYKELRAMLKVERLNYFLTGDELYNKKAKAIDIEFTTRLLSNN